MKISKRTWIILISIIAVCLIAGATVLTIFLLKDDANPQKKIEYAERELLVAQVGYDYQIPDWILEVSTDIKVKDSSGNELSVSNAVVHFDTLGDYTVMYGQDKSVPLKVIDSERPMFKGLWPEYNHVTIFPVNVTIGETVDLDDIFVPVDNSGGNIKVTYVIYHNGVTKVQPDQENCLLIEEGYYSVEVYAVDESGNGVKMSQKLTCVE